MHDVKVKNIPEGTSEIVLDEIHTCPEIRRYHMHAGTNDINKSINALNTVKKLKTKLKRLPNTRLVFPSLMLRKDKKDI